jgi:hypothetical protein
MEVLVLRYDERAFAAAVSSAVTDQEIVDQPRPASPTEADASSTKESQGPMLLGDVKMTVGAAGFSGDDAVIVTAGLSRLAVQLLVVHSARTLLPLRVTLSPGDNSADEEVDEEVLNLA